MLRTAPKPEMDHRTPAAAPAARPRLRFERVEQFRDRRRAIAGDIGLIEFDLGREIGVELPRQPRRGDDDLVLIVVAEIGIRLHRNGIDGLVIDRQRGRRGKRSRRKQGRAERERRAFHRERRFPLSVYLVLVFP